MKFDTPLIPGKLIKRYKRFLADVELEGGRVVTAHCANPGSMLGVAIPGVCVWVTPFPEESSRILKYRWELVRIDTTLVGINTMLPNTLMAEALEKKKIPELVGFPFCKREVKYGDNSRIDFLLWNDQNQRCYLEVKSVHLKRGGEAQFPDSVTSRGAKHLKDLMAVVKAGHRAIVFYIIQRSDCAVFSLAEDLDFFYSQTSKEARAGGVEFLAYACDVTPEEIVLAKKIELRSLRM